MYGETKFAKKMQVLNIFRELGPSHIWMLNETTGTVVRNSATDLMFHNNGLECQGIPNNPSVNGEIVGTIYKGEIPWINGFPSMRSRGTTSDVIRLPNLNIGAGVPRSVSMFVYMPTVPIKGTFVRIGDIPTGCTVGVGDTTFDTAGTKLIVEYHYIRIAYTGFNFVANKWYWVHVVFAPATPQLIVFVDGVQVYSDTSTAWVNPTGTYSTLFRSTDAARPFTGNIGAVLYFHRGVTSIPRVLRAYQQLKGKGII